MFLEGNYAVTLLKDHPALYVQIVSVPCPPTERKLAWPERPLEEGLDSCREM